MNIIKKVLKFLGDNSLNIIFLLTFVSTFGSLYFSEVVKLPPCNLCWYQRIFMYSLFILSAVAISFKEKLNFKYILALSIPGLLFSGYHYLVQKFSIGTQFLACGDGISCTQIDFEVLGFVTIPLLSFLAFVTIIVVTLINRRFSK